VWKEREGRYKKNSNNSWAIVPRPMQCARHCRIRHSLFIFYFYFFFLPIGFLCLFFIIVLYMHRHDLYCLFALHRYAVCIQYLHDSFDITYIILLFMPEACIFIYFFYQIWIAREQRRSKSIFFIFFLFFLFFFILLTSIDMAQVKEESRKQTIIIIIFIIMLIYVLFYYIIMYRTFT
jgi:hypothetical protein